MLEQAHRAEKTARPGKNQGTGLGCQEPRSGVKTRGVFSALLARYYLRI